MPLDHGDLPRCSALSVGGGLFIAALVVSPPHQLLDARDDFFFWKRGLFLIPRMADHDFLKSEGCSTAWLLYAPLDPPAARSIALTRRRRVGRSACFTGRICPFLKSLPDPYGSARKTGILSNDRGAANGSFRLRTWAARLFFFRRAPAASASRECLCRVFDGLFRAGDRHVFAHHVSPWAGAAGGLPRIRKTSFQDQVSSRAGRAEPNRFRRRPPGRSLPCWLFWFCGLTWPSSQRRGRAGRGVRAIESGGGLRGVLENARPPSSPPSMTWSLTVQPGEFLTPCSFRRALGGKQTLLRPVRPAFEATTVFWPRSCPTAWSHRFCRRHGRQR